MMEPRVGIAHIEVTTADGTFSIDREAFPDFDRYAPRFQIASFLRRDIAFLSRTAAIWAGPMDFSRTSRFRVPRRLAISVAFVVGRRDASASIGGVLRALRRKLPVFQVAYVVSSLRAFSLPSGSFWTLDVLTDPSHPLVPPCLDLRPLVRLQRGLRGRGFPVGPGPGNRPDRRRRVLCPRDCVSAVGRIGPLAAQLPVARGVRGRPSEARHTGRQALRGWDRQCQAWSCGS